MGFLVGHGFAALRRLLATGEVPNVAPSVAITSPAAATVFVTGVAQTISGTASDSDGTVASVKVYVDGILRGTATGTTTWSYSLTTDDTDAGGSSQARTVTAIATDNAGATTTSAGLSITCKTAVQNAIDSIKAFSPAVFYYNGFTIDGANAEAGDQISQWTDLSGNGRHATQSTQDDQPTIATVGPEYRLTFDAADGSNGDALTAPIAPYSNASALTTFVAMRRKNRTAQHDIWCSAAAHWRGWFSTTGSDAIRLFASTTAYAVLTAVWLNTDHVMCVRFDGGQVDNATRLRGWVDNVEQTMTYTGTIPSSIASITSFQLGRNGATSTPASVDYYLYLVFASALSDADRNAVDGHLKTLLSWY